MSMIKSRFSSSTSLFRQSCFVITTRMEHNLSLSLSVSHSFHFDYEDILATSNLSLMTLTATDVLLALCLFFAQHTSEWVFNQDESFFAVLCLNWLDLMLRSEKKIVLQNAFVTFNLISKWFSLCVVPRLIY